MKVKKAFLLLNGEAPKNLPNLQGYDLVCAIDGAYNYFKKFEIEPDLVTGDFDSIENIPSKVEVINTPDQNFTDFDKALQILFKRGFTEVDVYGGSGKEHDHFLGNLSTALHWKSKIKITFFDNFSKYFFIEKKVVLNNVKGRIISLIPFPIAEGITTTGLTYALNNESLVFGTRVGTRNTAKNNIVEITFTSGELLVYIGNKKSYSSKD